jgi:surface protein
MRLGLGLGLGMRGIRGGFDPDAFVVVFDTNLRAGSTTVELNINARTGGDRTVDWGDGTVTVENAALPSHTYATDGVYVVQVKGGTTTRLGQRGASPNAGWTDTLTAVIQWGKAIGWNNFTNGFQGVKQNFTVPADLPRTADGYSANVTTLSMMFRSAAAFNRPIGTWNTSSVTVMSQLFRDATAFNQPIGAWNVSAVTAMESMFLSANSFNQPIGAWDVSAVTDMTNLLRASLAFNQDIGSWPLRLAGVTMTDALNQAGLSTENYSRTLIGWANYVAANSNTPAAVTLGAQTRTYNNTVYVPAGTYTNAVDARAFLTSAAPSPAWSITDGGAV